MTDGISDNAGAEAGMGSAAGAVFCLIFLAVCIVFAYRRTQDKVEKLSTVRSSQHCTVQMMILSVEAIVKHSLKKTFALVRHARAA